MILLGFLLLNRRRQKSGFIGDVLMAALTESKRKKKRGRSLAMCVWTIVSWGLGLTSTFGSPSYNQSQPKTHGMVRSACFLAAAISFSAMPRVCNFFQHMWLAFATTISLLCCTHPNASPDTSSILFKFLQNKVRWFPSRWNPGGKCMLDGWSHDGGACAWMRQE